MVIRPGKHIRITIALFTLLFVVGIPVLSYGGLQDASDSRDAFGSITGNVVCPMGDIINGRVVLLEDGKYFDEDWDLGSDGEFSFDEVPPGDYELLFYEHGEIPLGEFVDVEVDAGRNTEVTITVPFTIDGMPCNEKLDMGITGFYDFIDSLLEDPETSVGWFSEMEQDWIAQVYGECKAQENDILIAGLSESDREIILELRGTLEDFEWGYYSVHFFMGTGAGHFGSRTLPWREEFIDSVIRRVDNPKAVTDDEISEAMDILDSLESAVEDAGEPYWDEETEVIFYETLDEFNDAASHLREITLELPDVILVMVAEYVSEYLSPDL